MKCKDCSSCKKGYFKCRPNDYVCIGVKEPFVICDINMKCSEYPEKRVEVKAKLTSKYNKFAAKVLKMATEESLDIDKVMCYIEKISKLKQHKNTER